ncbi:MAG TPA: structural protein [Alphaproteobacteria bacterium]|nr:structural protein [Alphaproteobacteria bacterium]
MIPMIPRGIRNNNPGNIRRPARGQAGDRWLGLAPAQDDPDFLTFAAPYFGLRALAVILRNYHDRHDLYTLADIIGRWAPATENDTAAYLRDVAAHMGADANESLDLHDPGTLAALVKAIIHHENGVLPYDDALIARAVESALA